MVSTTVYFIAHLIFTILNCLNDNALEISKWPLYIYSLYKDEYFNNYINSECCKEWNFYLCDLYTCTYLVRKCKNILLSWFQTKKETKNFIFNKKNKKFRMISFIFHYYQNYSGLPHTTSNINHYIKQEIFSSRTRTFFSKANTQMRSIFWGTMQY